MLNTSARPLKRSLYLGYADLAELSSTLAEPLALSGEDGDVLDSITEC